MGQSSNSNNNIQLYNNNKHEIYVEKNYLTQLAIDHIKNDDGLFILFQKQLNDIIPKATIKNLCIEETFEAVDKLKLFETLHAQINEEPALKEDLQKKLKFFLKKYHNMDVVSIPDAIEVKEKPNYLRIACQEVARFDMKNRLMLVLLEKPFIFGNNRSNDEITYNLSMLDKILYCIGRELTPNDKLIENENYYKAIRCLQAYIVSLQMGNDAIFPSMVELEEIVHKIPNGTLFFPKKQNVLNSQRTELFDFLKGNIFN